LSTAARVLSSESCHSGLAGGVAPLSELVEKCHRRAAFRFGGCLRESLLSRVKDRKRGSI
jgi:hypothetical protein